MLPGDGITPGIGKDKTCYTTNDNYKFKYGSEGLNTSEIKEYIRNPHKFNIKEEMDGKYYNLWSTDNDRTDANDDVVIKSVYDPSPVGYSLPASNAFTGFTTTGQNVGDWDTPATPEQKAKFNVKGIWDKGWYFYTKPNKKGSTVFFPTCGYRIYNTAKIGLISIYGLYWSGSPHSSSGGRHLLFSSLYVTVIYGSLNSYGFAVRSAEEKVLKHELDEIAKGVWVKERFIMRRLEEVATPSLKWTASIIICGVRIMIGLMLMMMW